MSVAKDAFTLTAGQVLGHYRIADKIGAGGMGDVYRAHDEHLDCDVAIKVLALGSVNDETARRRFHKEARVLSRLNHPNIAVVHDFDSHEGMDYLVMEFIPGITLSEKLAGRRLPENEVITLGIQLAEGLAKAHEHGVVHSDLKPGNLRITSDGRLKILDFGLARLCFPLTVSAATESSVEVKTIAGTLPYMAPEQIVAGEIDTRTDIYAAGCVLYEMATGRRPFVEVERARLVGAILHSQPLSPLSASSGVSVELDRIIRKCLEKEAENRYQSAKELAIDLRRLQMGTPSGTAPVLRADEISSERALVISVAKRHKGVLGGGAAVLVVLIAMLAYWLSPPLPPPTVSGYIQLTNDAHRKYLVGTDGARVYFEIWNGSNDLFAQVSVAGGDVATRPAPSPRMGLLSVSPDGSNLLVADLVQYGEEQLWALPVLGGPARRLADTMGHTGAWSPDGKKLVYANGDDLYIANADGTQSSKLVSAPGLAPGLLYWTPAWSPDGSEIRFSALDPRTQLYRLWQVSATGAGLHPLHADWHEADSECCGKWTSDGKHFVFSVFSSGGQVWAVREAKAFFRRSNLDPVQLTTGAANYYWPIPSKDGKKLYVTADWPRGELERFDARTKAFLPYLGGISAQDVAYSKDGQWMAYVTFPEGVLWRSKADGSDKLQLSSAPLYALNPSWSPDGKEIAFFSSQPGKGESIYLVSADGGTPVELAPNAPGGQSDPVWSPDGDSIAFGVGWGRPSQAAILVLNRKTGQISKIPGSEAMYSPRWSPDGRYLVAMPTSEDRLMLFDFSTQKWSVLATVSAAGYPCWSRDSQYVYSLSVLSEKPGIMRVKVSDRQIDQVASLMGSRLTGHFGFWLGLAPDDSPLILKDTGTQEIVALDWHAP